jgi:PBSX family phage portal protein
VAEAASDSLTVRVSEVTPQPPAEDPRAYALDLIAKMIATPSDEAPGQGLATSNLRAREEEQFTELGALPNPYPPEMLVRLFERSSALRPCVDAIVTNVHGFGFRLTPRINLEAADADAQIAQAILSEKLYEGDDDPDEPTTEEVAERRKQIARGMERERLRLNVLLENINEDGFIELRRRIWTDYEITGNAYLEVVRDAKHRVARLNYAPSTNMRLQKLERDFRMVDRRMRISPIAYADTPEPHRFRGFIQIVNGYTTYFKEFQDTRVMSAQSGRFYTDEQSLPAHETPATEIIHFALFSSRTSYGIPRWIGAAFAVLGIRAAEEVNYLHFDNKAMPPMAVLVSGGALSKGGAEHITKFMESRLKGRANYHSVMVLEALPAQGSSPEAAGRTRIALQPLAQQQDGLFQVYADRSEDVVAQQFRLSPIVRGKVKDFNRASAEASLRKDEQQVFQPERGAFDERFDRTILTDLGIRYWRMESNSPVASDPEQLTRIIDTLLKDCGITPAEARPFINDILNGELPKITGAWGQLPPSLTLGGIQPEAPPPDPPKPVEQTADAGGGSPAEKYATLSQQLMALRDQIKAADTKAQDEAFEKALDDARKSEAGVEVMQVDAETFSQWVTPHT